jgi:hypothetical protein
MLHKAKLLDGIGYTQLINTKNGALCHPVGSMCEGLLKLILKYLLEPVDEGFDLRLFEFFLSFLVTNTTVLIKSDFFITPLDDKFF